MIGDEGKQRGLKKRCNAASGDFEFGQVTIENVQEHVDATARDQGSVLQCDAIRIQSSEMHIRGTPTSSPDTRHLAG